MRWEGSAESPKGLSCERGVRGMLVSVHGTTVFVPSVLLFAGNTAGGFPGEAFLEKRRAEPGQELSRGPETVPGSVARAGLSMLPPGSLAAGP